MTEGGDHDLEAEKTNGVYCFRIDKELDGYSVYGGGKPTVVQTVKINGGYIGISDAIEIECQRYELEDDTLNLIIESGGESSTSSQESVWQCRHCTDYMKEQEVEDAVWYEEQPHHPECFKEKAREEMPEEAAEKVVEHVEDGVRKFRVEGEGLRPVEIKGESSSTSMDSPNGNVTGSSAPRAGGEPPKSLGSKCGGDEDNGSGCCQVEDKPEPDAWLQVRKICEETYQCATIDDRYPPGTTEIESEEPLFSAATIHDTIDDLQQKIYANGFGENDKAERVEAIQALEKLKKVFDPE